MNRKKEKDEKKIFLVRVTTKVRKKLLILKLNENRKNLSDVIENLLEHYENGK